MMVRATCRNCGRVLSMPALLPGRLEDRRANQEAESKEESCFVSHRYCVFCQDDQPFEVPVQLTQLFSEPQSRMQQTLVASIAAPMPVNAAEVTFQFAEQAARDGRYEDAVRLYDEWASLRGEKEGLDAELKRLKKEALRLSGATETERVGVAVAPLPHKKSA